ncbi:hypothetical protein I79_023182 [Cricetulus griseus]|uniref:Uncharacterized protein n=1 Tax=Cricetulus griseus TaxID=10029 RepID=G3IH94_CRIGR|nr:hypothetical protein I79_023182 [Cricetulus griseus]
MGKTVSRWEPGQDYGHKSTFSGTKCLAICSRTQLGSFKSKLAACLDSTCGRRKKPRWALNTRHSLEGDSKQMSAFLGQNGLTETDGNSERESIIFGSDATL